MADPAGPDERPVPTRQSPPPPAPPTGQAKRWVTVGLPLVVAALVVIALVLYVLVGPSEGELVRGSATPAAGESASGSTDTDPPSPAPSTGPTASPPLTTPPPPPPTSPAPPPAEAPPTEEIIGQWVGEGTLTACEGFSNDCPPGLPFRLEITCGSSGPCFVVPLEGYMSSVLSPSAGGYSARGPVPTEVSPTCDGSLVLASWLLTVTVEDGRLVGGYTETTTGALQCAPTRAAWDITLTRG